MSYYDTSSGRIEIPWLDYNDKIKSAKVSVSGITSTTYMFSGCENLESISFDNFDTSAVTNMSYMFSICSSLKNLDLSSLNTGKVRTMEGMFYKCKALKNLDLRNFDTSRVTNMEWMFGFCTSLQDLDVSNFDTRNLSKMFSMFDRCKELKDLDLSSFDTHKVKDMCGVFWECTNLESIKFDKEKFNTSNVKYFECMFYGCESLRSIDVSGFDTSNASGFTAMFQFCSSLTTLDLSNFVVKNVNDSRGTTSISDMFLGCSNLKTLILGEFDTSHVRYFGDMFYECSSLEELDISGFDMHNAVDISGMFYKCSSLKKLNLSKSNLCNVTEASYVLSGADNLKELNAPKNCKVSIKLPGTLAWRDSAGNVYTEIPYLNYSENLYRSDFAGVMLSGDKNDTAPDVPLEEFGKKSFSLTTPSFEVTDIRKSSVKRTLDVNEKKQCIYIFGSITTCFNTQKVLQRLTELISYVDMEQLDIYAFDIYTSDSASIVETLNLLGISDKIIYSPAVSGSARELFYECGAKFYESSSYSVNMPLIMYKDTSNNVYISSEGIQTIDEIIKNIEGGGLKTNYKIIAPVITSAINTDIGEVAIQWEKEKEVSGYELQYSKSATFANGVTKKTFSEMETSAKCKGLSDGVYYVRLRAFRTMDGQSRYSEWSATRKVSVIGKIKAPVITSAINTDIGEVAIRWEKEKEALGYELQYSKSATFASGVTKKTFSEMETNAKCKGLSNGVYYVRLRTFRTMDGQKRYSEWSAKRKVSVIGKIKAPVISSVKNRSSKRMTVKWKKVSGALGYQLQYSTKKKFSSNVKKKNFTITSASFSKLIKKKTYYVRVRAYVKINGKTKYSSWSKVKSVKIKK